jgi:hypothetical protein
MEMVSGQYFNKGVKSLDSPHVGHVVRETSDKIVAVYYFVVCLHLSTILFSDSILISASRF